MEQLVPEVFSSGKSFPKMVTDCLKNFLGGLVSPDSVSEKSIKWNKFIRWNDRLSRGITQADQVGPIKKELA